jgi:hypothetical protein
MPLLCNLLFNSVAMTSYTTMFMNIEVALYTLGKFHSFMEYNSFLHMIGFNLQNSYSWVFERCVLRNASIGILITECTYTMLHGSHVTKLSNFWGHHHIRDLVGTQLSLCGLWTYFRGFCLCVHKKCCLFFVSSNISTTLFSLSSLCIKIMLTTWNELGSVAPVPGPVCNCLVGF